MTEVKTDHAEAQLKPCPFCGNKETTPSVDVDGYSYRFYVRCGCGAQSCKSTDESEVIEHWNTRTAPTYRLTTN